MVREPNPGLKILWVWAFGTAGILVTTVLRTRMKDMEKILNGDDHDQHDLKTPTTASSSESIVSDTTFSDGSEQVFAAEDKS